MHIIADTQLKDKPAHPYDECLPNGKWLYFWDSDEEFLKFFEIGGMDEVRKL